VINLGTLAGLLEHQHRLAAYCPRCDRWAVLNLDAMVAAGHRERRLPILVRCQVCGEVGRPQVRPPGQTRPHSVGWVQIPAG
jgi:RNase P subunit RPR2